MDCFRDRVRASNRKRAGTLDVKPKTPREVFHIFRRKIHDEHKHIVTNDKERCCRICIEWQPLREFPPPHHKPWVMSFLCRSCLSLRKKIRRRG